MVRGHATRTARAAPPSSPLSPLLLYSGLLFAPPAFMHTASLRCHSPTPYYLPCSVLWTFTGWTDAFFTYEWFAFPRVLVYALFANGRVTITFYASPKHFGLRFSLRFGHYCWFLLCIPHHCTTAGRHTGLFAVPRILSPLRHMPHHCAIADT